MKLTAESKNFLRYMIGHIAVNGCKGISCKRCVLKVECKTRTVENSKNVAKAVIEKYTNKESK